MRRRFFENWVVANPFAGWERQQSVEDDARWNRRKKRWKVFEKWCERKINRMTPPGFEWMPIVNWSVAGMGICSLISIFRFLGRYGKAWRALKWDIQTMAEYEGYVREYYGVRTGESLWFIGNGKYKDEWMTIREFISVVEEGELISSFSWVMKGVMAPFVYLMAIILLLTIFHYLYYYRETKSIYLMKRLPNRSELHRRSLSLPLILVAACVVVIVLLTAVCCGWYYLWVPDRCIAPGQLSHFLREGIFTMWRGDGL